MKKYQNPKFSKNSKLRYTNQPKSSSKLLRSKIFHGHLRPRRWGYRGHPHRTPSLITVDKGDHRRQRHYQRCCNRQNGWQLGFKGWDHFRSKWSLNTAFRDSALIRLLFESNNLKFSSKNSFPQLTPLNLMRIQAGACWIWKKNQNSRCRKFKIVNNNSKKCQIWFKIIPQTVLYFHPIPLISNSF